MNSELEQRIKTVVQREARSYYALDPIASQVQISDVLLERGKARREVGAEVWDAHVRWDVPQEGRMVYTVWVLDSGELSVFGPEF